MIEYHFFRIAPTRDTWKVIESTYDSTVDKTQSWFEYLECQGCKPFIVEVRESGNLIGYFVGELLKRGVWVVGSPFEGISTAHQGLSMLAYTDPDTRIEIYRQLSRWIFRHRYAMLVQIEDWQLEMHNLEGKSVRYEGHDTSWVDLRGSEDEIYHRFSQKSCRYMINKAIKNGVVIRESQDVNKFLDVHFAQHQEVMERKGMGVLKSKEGFRTLIQKMYPQHLLLLEAVSSEGEIVSTGIYAIGGKNAHFLSRASYEKDNKLSPNELITWEAIKRSKERGAEFFNNSGVSTFKLKFGSCRDYRPRLIFSKYEFLFPLRKWFKNLAHKVRFKLSSIGIFISR